MDKMLWRSIALDVRVIVSLSTIFRGGMHCAALRAGNDRCNSVATQSLFPGFPAFSFGLPCIALLVGGYPYLKSRPIALLNPYWIIVAGLCATVAVMVH